MARMKKFLLYLIIFLAFFGYTTFMTDAYTKTSKNKINNIEILTKTPTITVSECEADKYSGNIKGTVTNNTGEHIKLSFLKIDLYDDENIYLGTKYKELNYFNSNETIKFDEDYRYKEVKGAKLSIVKEKDEESVTTSKSNFFANINPTITENEIKIGSLIASVLILKYILP